MSTPSAERRPRYSYFDQLVEKMEQAAAARIRRLSANDIKAVMLWLESRQVRQMVDAVTYDEALLAAKARGGIELVDELNGELLGILGEIGKPKEETEEGEVDGEL
jgi:hypothetical protein